VSPLSSVEEVRAVVLGGRDPLPAVPSPLEDALGLVLASPVTAAHAVPGFENSAMDGYALRSVDIGPAGAQLVVVGNTMAGQRAGSLGRGEAIRIMTGAPMPTGADTVVPLEEIMLNADGTLVLRRNLPAGANVRRVGEDVERDAIVLRARTLLGAAHLGLLSSVGVTEVEVHPRPRVGVLSTGDELVTGGGDLDVGQIRDANRPALIGAVAESGFVPVDLGAVGDDADSIRRAVEDALPRSDALVLSGGVSVGDRDAVFDVLAGLSPAARAFAVAIRPGRPFVFAEVSRAPVFALPGNPVAAMIAFELFARPALRAMAGHLDLERPRLRAIADEALRRRRDGKVHYVRATLTVGPGGILHARSAGPQNSHLLSVSARAAGLVVLADGEGAAVGEEVEVMVLDWERVTAGSDPETSESEGP